MKGGMGLIGLLVVLLIIGLLAKKQLGSTGQLAVAPKPAVEGVQMPTASASATVKEQSQQIQQQIKQQVEAAMQVPPRKEPDEK